MKKKQIINIMKKELRTITEANNWRPGKEVKANVGNLFIVKDGNGHIHLEIGGRSGQMNLGYAGTDKVKKFIKILRDYGAKR